MIETPEIREQNDQHQLCSVQDMYKIAREMIEHHRVDLEDYGLTVEDVVGLDEYVDPHTKTVSKERVRYELRQVQFPYSEAGIVGRISQFDFERIVAHSLADELVRLRWEQPGCDWQIIGAKIERVNINRTIEVKFEGRSETVNTLSNWVDSEVPVALSRKKGHRQVPDYRFICHLVYCDLAKGDLVDPALNSPLGKSGPMTEYANSRLLRHLQDQTRRNRVKTVQLLRALAGEPEPPPTPKPVRKPRKPGGKLATKAPELVAPAVQDLRETVIQLRRDASLNPNEIVEHLDGKVTLEEVREILRGGES